MYTQFKNIDPTDFLSFKRNLCQIFSSWEHLYLISTIKEIFFYLILRGTQWYKILLFKRERVNIVWKKNTPLPISERIEGQVRIWLQTERTEHIKDIALPMKFVTDQALRFIRVKSPLVECIHRSQVLIHSCPLWRTWHCRYMRKCATVWCVILLCTLWFNDVCFTTGSIYPCMIKWTK